MTLTRDNNDDGCTSWDRDVSLTLEQFRVWIGRFADLFQLIPQAAGRMNRFATWNRRGVTRSGDRLVGWLTYRFHQPCAATILRSMIAHIVLYERRLAGTEAHLSHLHVLARRAGARSCIARLGVTLKTTAPSVLGRAQVHPAFQSRQLTTPTIR